MSGNATDRLRELLDERGVEWNDGGEGLTIIPVQYGVPRAWTVNTWPSGKDMGDCLWVQNRHPLTPEQAIAATVGRGNLTAEQVRESIERHSTESLGCRRQFRERDWQAIADELNATVGRGTCRNVSTTGNFRCSECDAVDLDFDKPTYCHRCGRKVVDE